MSIAWYDRTVVVSHAKNFKAKNFLISMFTLFKQTSNDVRDTISAIVFSTFFITCVLDRPYFETHENNEDGTKQNRMGRNTRQNENRCLHTIRRRDFCFNDPKFAYMYIRCWLITFFFLHFVIVIFISFSLSRHKFSQKHFGLLVLGYFDIVADFSLYSTRHSIRDKNA